MKRLDFLKNIAGAIAATVIGSRLEIITDTIPVPAAPPIIKSLFKLYVSPGSIRVHDIIMIPDGNQFYIGYKSAKLMAISINNPDFNMEIVEDINCTTQYARLASAYSENTNF